MKVNQDISKLFYARRINADTEMKSVISRNSMIAEDLGRIEYFLTDKTGTLTKNEMIMKKVNIGDKTSLEASQLDKMTQLALQSTQNKELSLIFSENDKGKKFYRMICCLLTCHAVYPKIHNDGKRELDSTSPDEISFIEFCENIGFRLEQRTDHIVSFTTPDKKLHEFRILKVFSFTSARARMGMVFEWNG
jgi:phospholipid-translocating ATPase